MLRLSRVLIVTALVVALCAPMAFATTSRIIAMAETFNYINDNANIFRWYGTLPSYANMVYAEAGQAMNTSGASMLTSVDYQALGFTYTRGEESPWGTWGIFLLHNSVNDMSLFYFNPLENYGNDGLPGVSATNPPLPTTKLVLMWGRGFGDWDVGVVYTNSNASIETPAGSPLGGVNNKQFSSIGGGVRWDVNPDHYVDASLTFSWSGGDSTVGGTTTSRFANSSSWEIGARAFREHWPELTIVPYFGYRSYDFALEGTAAPNGNKGYQLDLGVSFNWDVNANNLLMFVTEVGWANNKPSRQPAAPNDQAEINVQVLPTFRVALESDITSWLTTRVGAVKTLAQVKVKAADGAETIYTDVNTVPGVNLEDFGWFLGTGFHVGEWDIDLVLSDETPFRLGYWLTGFGGNDNTPPVGRISGIYRF